MNMLSIEGVLHPVCSVQGGLEYGQMACEPILKAFHNEKCARIPTYKFFLPFVVTV